MLRTTMFLFVCLFVVARVFAADPTATTGPATALGLSALSVNGVVQPRGLPTSYYFEYGPTAAYGSKSAVAPVPPRLAAYYHESFDDNLAGWQSWLKVSHHKSGGAKNGFARFTEPSNHDHNHDNGIGTLHLLKYLYPGVHAPSLYLGGGDPDFRDAKISLHVRGVDFQPRGSEFLFWSQSQIELPIDRPDWKRPNYAYTGTTLTDLLLDGKWHQAEYRLLNDTTKWSYGGGERGYVYGSIDGALGHLNVDFFHLLACVDTKNPPTGSIDVDELTIAYRNYSLLLSSNGGKLTSSPAGGEGADLLTDGWRNGPGKTWRSAPDPSGPQEFTWTFERPVTVNSVVLHQNPEWPAKEVEVLASADGKAFTPLTKLTLAEVGKPPQTPDAISPNWAFALDRKLAAKAAVLKVRILSGYRPKHWVLGEVEVFGSGAILRPDDDEYRVNADIGGLAPGGTIHYRLVATGEWGTARGDDRTYTTPSTKKPLAETGPASRLTATTAKVEGRLNPLGEESTFWFEYGLDAKYGAQTPATRGGLQITPRSAYGHFSGLAPATTYHYRLVVQNASGLTHGADAEFKTLR